MFKKAMSGLAALFLFLGAYLLTWPVPIDPVVWDAPVNPGYNGAYIANDELTKIERISLGKFSGPEDMAIGPDGMLYIPTHEGVISRVDPKTKSVSEFAKTGGRPLGIEFSKSGALYVADAYRGLLEISSEGKVTVLADETDSGSPIHYADDLDIAPDGSVYFTDASTRFGAKQNGGTLPASFLDLMEHSSNGRVLKYSPTTGKTEVFQDKLNFANGLAMTADGKHYLVVETGSYTIWKVALDGSSKPQVVVENLPGFPDNINRNPDGTFWVGLVSPRSDEADSVSGSPLARKVIMRLPAFMRPSPQRYGFVLKINEQGEILKTMQDPTGAYAMTTGLIESENGDQYVTSLTEPDLAMIKP